RPGGGAATCGAGGMTQAGADSTIIKAAAATNRVTVKRTQSSSALFSRSGAALGAPATVCRPCLSRQLVHVPARVPSSLDSPPKRHEFEFSVPVRVPHRVKILIAI